MSLGSDRVASMYREVAGVVGFLKGIIDLDRSASLNALEIAVRAVDADPSLRTSLYAGVEAILRGGDFAEEDYQDALPWFLGWAKRRFSFLGDHRFQNLLSRVLERRDAPAWLRTWGPWEEWVREAGLSPVVWEALATGGRLRDEEVWEIGRYLRHPAYAVQGLFTLVGVSQRHRLPEELARIAWGLCQERGYIELQLSFISQPSIPLAWVLDFLAKRERGFPGDPGRAPYLFPRVLDRFLERPMTPEEVVEAEKALHRSSSPYRSLLWAHPAYPLESWEDKLPWVLLHPQAPKEVLLRAVRGEFDKNLFASLENPLAPEPSSLVGRNPSLSLRDLQMVYEDFPKAPKAPLFAWRSVLASSPKEKGPRVPKEGLRFLLRKSPSTKELVGFLLHPEVTLEEAEDEVGRRGKFAFRSERDAEIGGPLPIQAFLALRFAQALGSLSEDAHLFYPLLGIWHRLPPEWGEKEVRIWERGGITPEVGGL